MNIKAFTLIELIIVIATISILATFAFVAIDPGKRIGQANDDERLVEARSIQIAIEKYTADNFNLPPSILELNNGVPYMITYSSNTSDFVYCSEILGNIQVVNLSDELAAYLPVLPIDPSESNPVVNGIGYYLRKNKDLLIEITPCDLYANDNDFIGNEIKSETVFYNDDGWHYSAVTLLNGNMFIVYRGVDYKGYFVIYDSEGRLIKSEEIFSDTVGNHKIIPTTLLNGNVFILYRAADYDTYFVIYDSEGRLVKSEELFDTTSLTHFSATTLLNGNIFITYQDNSSGSYKGYFVIYDSEGMLIKSEEEFHDGTYWNATNNTLSNGNVVISYRGSDYKGYFVIYDSEGNIISAETAFHEEGVAGDMFTHATALLNGNIFIVYDEGTSNKFVIYDSEGTLIKSEEEFNSESSVGSYANTLLNNNVMIIYEDGSYSYFVIYDSEGTLIKSEEVLNDNEDSDSARATTFLNGNVMIIYEDQSQVDTKAKFVIYE